MATRSYMAPYIPPGNTFKYDLNEMTGKQLIDLMIRLVEDPSWTKEKVFYFYSIFQNPNPPQIYPSPLVSNPTHSMINRTPYMIYPNPSLFNSSFTPIPPDHRNECFTLKAKRTENQPGNGILSFGGKFHRWSELQGELKDCAFPTLWRKYYNEKIGQNDFQSQKYMTCVLLSFEIARRVETSKYPVTRGMTGIAINNVMATGFTTDYENKVKYINY